MRAEKTNVGYHSTLLMQLSVGLKALDFCQIGCGFEQKVGECTKN